MSVIQQVTPMMAVFLVGNGPLNQAKHTPPRKYFLTHTLNFGIIINMEKIIKWQQEPTISH